MNRAFVMGSNGPNDPLLSKIQFAMRDANMITEQLSNPRCGFEVIRAKNDTGINEVHAELSRVAKACEAKDTFICYFAGHGLVEKSELFLLWEDSDIRGLYGTALPISQVMLAMRFCEAQNKLLILDCCHAGAAVASLRSGIGERAQEMGVEPENHMVLMASDRLERARELEELEGGFLTTHLCSALGENFRYADGDGDTMLSLDDLKVWLEKRAAEHNSRFPDRKVPVPYLFGQRRGPFFLTAEAPKWNPYELFWPDGSTMVVLPAFPSNGYAYCLSKHPITNVQYKKFVNDCSLEEPCGEKWVAAKSAKRRLDGRWEGPFYPWQEESFFADNKPIVCIGSEDVKRYCKWVNSLNPLGVTKVVDSSIWVFAAFGRRFLPYDAQLWMGLTNEIHHKNTSPASVDVEGKRTNHRGIADMIGNVWEWTFEMYEDYDRPSLGAPSMDYHNINVQGGGFLDDMSRTLPVLSSHDLPNGSNTKHSDLGFRIAAKVTLHNLPDEVIQGLELHGVKIEEGGFFMPLTV